MAGPTGATRAVGVVEVEQPRLLPAPERPYAVQIYVEVKVHRDYHLLTELIPAFRHVSAVIDRQRSYRRCHVRRRRGRARSVGVGGAGGWGLGGHGTGGGATLRRL